MPATLTVTVPILILEVLLAIPFAMAVATVRGSLTDRAVMVCTTVALSISLLVYVILGAVPVRLPAGLVPGAGLDQQLLVNLTTYAPLPVPAWWWPWAWRRSCGCTAAFFLDELGPTTCAPRAPREPHRAHPCCSSTCCAMP